MQDCKIKEMISQLSLTQPLIINYSGDYTEVIIKILQLVKISESDVVIFDGSSPIKDLRDTISELLVKPHSSALRLFAITNCENMSDASSNTLLKLLEEPPEYLKIILLTGSYARILPTIKSRCKRIFLSRDIAVFPRENLYDYFINKSFVDFSKHIAKFHNNDELAVRVKNTLEVMRKNGLNKTEGRLFSKLSDAYIKLSSQNINGKLKLEGIFIDFLAKDA
jgi:hypothetical protein